MGFLSRLLGRSEAEPEEVTITLDVERRRAQLKRLESALDALSRRMRDEQTMDNPGWRGRVNEYSRLAGEAAMLRRAPTRDAIVDLVFEIRPVFSGVAPEGMEGLLPLQEELMAAAEDLRTLLPGEKG